MDERRRASRHRTLKSGKIVVHAGRSVVDCTVRNLSSNGALLLVRSLAGIPEKFDLVMETTGEHHLCRVAWRGEDRLGVEFARVS
jgi:PilZ domain